MAFIGKADAKWPYPYYVFVDEAQEIGPGMRLESMLAEGTKFGCAYVCFTAIHVIDEKDSRNGYRSGSFAGKHEYPGVLFTRT